MAFFRRAAPADWPSGGRKLSQPAGDGAVKRYRAIHHSAALSRCITDVERAVFDLDFTRMDSQIFAFEQTLLEQAPMEQASNLPLIAGDRPSGDHAGVPLRCPRAMPEQPLQVTSSFSLLGSLVAALLFVPRAAMLAPAMIRTTRRRA